MERRADANRFGLALLLETNRLVVTGGLALAVFVGFVATATAVKPPFIQQLQSGDMIESMFTTMISVVVTGTTLVVAIGQLVLTQENGPLGDQRNRMGNAMDFREFTQELTGEPSPTEPGAFLDALVTATITRSRVIREELSDGVRGDIEAEIDEFVEDVVSNAQAVSGRLESAEFGSFDVVSAALNFNYGWKIARIEQFKADYADELDDADIEHLDALRTSLSMFGPAREHVKTLYFQWELIVLSKLILYAAIPAVVVAAVMTAAVTPSTVSGTLYGIEHITLVVGAAFTVTLLPFLLFAVYLLRILTVAKRTLAIEPLILHE